MMKKCITYINTCNEIKYNVTLFLKTLTIAITITVTIITLIKKEKWWKVQIQLVSK